jgi:hypothetical protein
LAAPIAAALPITQWLGQSCCPRSSAGDQWLAVPLTSTPAADVLAESGGLVADELVGRRIT